MFSSETSHGRSWQDSSPPSIGKRQELASDQDDTSSATVTQEFSSQIVKRFRAIIRSHRSVKSYYHRTIISRCPYCNCSLSNSVIISDSIKPIKHSFVTVEMVDNLLRHHEIV
ncbi:hypothetical protein D6C85_00687 [Aureobasidium pullulans]|uniref:Uncharacterized protein n=1 Tax=Aureobasidium pullulans TaxID=5580 RepID=A0A4V4IQ06_AURPU|nr:hypothetical protein D6D22_00306 [Aureobasidium pullulans]THW68147.1 hypothetical protein D6D20_00004 [Aureobasidium pullulans]THZ79078.1 hypothetical protein D6C85_00687 [Aureobasidium pullulans]TIA05150.1 hypothetical protein D6C82_00365 [Aureobasidium pullulans]